MGRPCPPIVTTGLSAPAGEADYATTPFRGGGPIAFGAFLAKAPACTTDSTNPGGGPSGANATMPCSERIVCVCVIPFQASGSEGSEPIGQTDCPGNGSCEGDAIAPSVFCVPQVCVCVASTDIRSTLVPGMEYLRVAQSSSPHRRRRLQSDPKSSRAQAWNAFIAPSRRATWPWKASAHLVVFFFASPDAPSLQFEKRTATTRRAKQHVSVADGCKPGNCNIIWSPSASSFAGTPVGASEVLQAQSFPGFQRTPCSTYSWTSCLLMRRSG